MGLDIWTKEQKSEDERREDEYRPGIIRQLAFRYDRKKIYQEIGGCLVTLDSLHVTWIKDD